MDISCVELANNDVICLRAIEINTIPDLSITNYKSEEEIRKAYSELMKRTLSEVFQFYKSQFNHESFPDIALELLWVTEPVINQTYAARIRLFFLFRCVANTNQAGKDVLNRITNVFCNTLELNKYGFTSVDFSEVNSALKQINSEHTVAVVKEGRMETMQIAAMPQCYTYDTFGADAPATEVLVNTLLRHPHSAVTIQLMPTLFTPDEESLIDNACQALGVLVRGVQSPGWNMVFESAQAAYNTYSYYNSNKNRALFSYNVIIRGKHDAVEDIASSIRTQLRGENEINTLVLPLESALISSDDSYYPAPWILHERLTEETSSQTYGLAVGCIRLPNIITAEEAATLFCVPIGGPSIKAGFVINESEQTNKQYGEGLIDSGDITIGKLKNSNNTIGLSLKDIAKHMLVVGTPGSGKTTFSVSLLDRLWKDHHIPFLVIEPAKNEYRALVQSIPDLQVFTPGKNTVSPFVFNPFIPPQNVKLEAYKSTLKTAFAAAVSMSTPLDKIFEESINNCYSDFRWLDTYTSDDRGQTFNIADFIKCFQYTFDEIGYTGDAKNVGRAGVVRLNSLVNLFDNYFTIPIKDILEKPTVIELAAIENSDKKALIIALLLLSILAYVNANYIGEGSLKNVILLEEAHVLLDAETNAGQGEANPSAIAQGLVKRMLAEIRSYGVGIIVADQSPRKVSADVVALTDIKMIFRLVESSDKHIIADSTNMEDVQIQRMSRLKPGEAFLFFNRLDEPEEIVTPDYRLENKIAITLSDESIRMLSTYWNDKQEKLRPYPQCSMCKFCAYGCDFQRRVLAREVARRIFTKNFRSRDTSFEPLEGVLRKITRLIKDELNGEPFSAELFSCVKVHLWRKVRYGTKIPVTDIQIKNSLSK